MSVAPIIAPQDSASSATARSGAHRPKRIQPPAHWQAPTPARVTKSAVPIPVRITIAPTPTRMSTRRFTLLLTAVIIALNVLLIWLFPLPQAITRHRMPVFTPAPVTAEKSELPVWLRL